MDVKSQRSKVKGPSGYTIVELLISIAIFVFLTTITVFAFRGAGQANDLRQSAAELVANLRRVQTMSQTGATVSVCIETPVITCTVSTASPLCTCTPLVPKGGFGIYVVANATQYQIFADLPSVGFLNGNGEYESSAEPIITNGLIAMLRGTKISSATTASVTFVPPKALPKQSNPITYCITHDSLSDKVRKVTVTKETGQIQEEAVSSCP